MKNLFVAIRRAVKRRWECRTKRCSYYAHYLAYGPAHLTHIGYHSAEKLGGAHFANCSYSGPGLCSICESWERRLRA